MRKLYWIVLILVGLFIISNWLSDDDTDNSNVYSGSGVYGSPGVYGSSGDQQSMQDVVNAHYERERLRLEQEEREREYMDDYWERQQKKAEEIGTYDVDTDD